MCLLAVCEKRNLTDSEFTNSWRGNSDGAGFAWVKGGVVYFEKGFMIEEEALSFYNKTVKNNLLSGL